MYIKNTLTNKLTAFLSLFTVETCILCTRGNINICNECLYSLPPPKECPSPCSYVLLSYRNEKVKKILQTAKYNHKSKLYGPLVAFLLAQNEVKGLLALKENMLIFPLPVHYFRLLARGQNHTRTLANLLEKETGIKVVTNVLRKIRNTKKQMLLSRSERLRNQIESFEVKKGFEVFVRGKNIVLIDDIVTTGSTLAEVKKLLMNAGAKKVICLVLAH